MDDRRPAQRFTSLILPPYIRRSPRLNEALPVLYLRGLSTGDVEEAIPVLPGADAAGFSATTITRLLRVWQEEHGGWRKRLSTGKEYVYVWADGVYFSVRLGEDKQLASLVLVGVLPDGTKEVIALEDGYRESTVKARTRKTKGAGSRKAGLAMALKLLLAAEKRWRRINAPQLLEPRGCAQDLPIHNI